ncbi:hypothetical protein [Algoriphagus confluentis]|uniref:Glycosyltransferase RgtA/B/C/D-like domain-containing protein n=1 Tax=Algoriphagus confluentis TaxID=1697556 RepID=A0ABQ6PUL2_9BACT|nr:hypothetical protein Aconfl_43090 [Algoriphagus confluentis]
MKSKILLNTLFVLALSGIYLSFGYFLRTKGYYHLEGYFIDYKIDQLFRYDISFFRTFYFTEPALLFLGSLGLSWIPKIQSTYLLNALVMGILGVFLFKSAWERRSGSWASLIYLLFSPVIWYAGSSGSSFALYLTFYFLFFWLILGYIRSYSVFHLASLSILLGAFLLLDRSFLKLLILLIPVFFFISFYKAKGIHGNFYAKASVIFSNDSQRRKFFTGFFSSILLVVFIPLSGFGIFHLINEIFGGRIFYYETSLADFWNSYSGKTPLHTADSLDWKIFSVGNLYFLLLILCLSVSLLYLFFRKGKSTALPMIAFLALGYVVSEAAGEKILNLNLQLLGMLSGAGMAGILFSAKEIPSAVFKGVSLFIALVAIVLEFFYFQFAASIHERRFMEAITQSEVESKELKNIESIHEFLAEKGKTRILADDAIFFPHLSQLPPETSWIGHFSPDFQHSLQEPAIYADYLVISQDTHPLHLNDIVAAALDRLEFHGIPLKTKVVFQDELGLVLEVLE